MPIVIQSVSIEKFLTWLDAATTAQFLFLLSPAKSPFSRGFLIQKRVYSTLNLTPKKKYSTVNPTSTLSDNNGKNIKQLISYKPETLALQHIETNAPTTSKVINNLLLNQKVSITQENLTKILNISYVTFKLPLNSKSYLAYLSLVGKPSARGK
jgi:hypothetical protein